MILDLRANLKFPCPVCGREDFYHRVRTMDYRCRRCGGEFYLGQDSKFHVTKDRREVYQNAVGKI